MPAFPPLFREDSDPLASLEKSWGPVPDDGNERRASAITIKEAEEEIDSLKKVHFTPVVSQCRRRLRARSPICPRPLRASSSPCVWPPAQGCDIWLQLVFNLKMRIHFLEERMIHIGPQTQNELAQEVVELKVQLEETRKVRRACQQTTGRSIAPRHPWHRRRCSTRTSC